jgi:creatinine amidohydrolase
VHSGSQLDGRRFAALTSPAAARARGAAVLVPTGSVEQHGPHLPVGTDTLIASAIAREIAATTDGVLVAEPIAYGCSWHHSGFSGTVTVTVNTFVAMVVDVCRSLLDQGFTPILLNGHAGNRAPLDVALTELAETGHRSAALSYFDLIQGDARNLIPDADSATGHACALETSISLYLWPDAVDSDAVPAGGTPETWPDPHMFARREVALVRRFDEINPTGVIGRPSLATAEIGERLFNAAVRRGRDAVDRARGQLAR